jgi:predicted nucleotide-binding protein
MDDIEGRVSRLISEGQAFTFESFAERYETNFPVALSAAWCSWTARTEMLIDQAFGRQSTVGEMLRRGLARRFLGNGQEKFADGKAQILGALTAARDAIREGFPLKKQALAPASGATASGRVFIVHGHDMELKSELEIFLVGVGLEPIVLHREPDMGATVLEKFEKHADVGYAFILLTPDEFAYPSEQASVPERERAVEKRARPNVIFEFGFFVGRLGRERVCCIYKGDVKLPSDLEGIVYKKVVGPLETIAFGLVKELRAAGYAIVL